MNDSHYDYIIVGAGSAGCLAAGRLVGDHQARVLLLEEGPADSNPLIHMPAGFVKLLSNTSYMTFHKSAEHPHLHGRMPSIPQGRVLGGGSSVNAMVYIRGQERDYDTWAQATGDNGWRFDSLLPHFVRMEGNRTFNNARHGAAGPLRVSDPTNLSDVSRAFVQSAQATGLHYNADFNSGDPSGAGFYQVTTDGRRRCSAVDAFLTPVRKDPRLTVRTGARVLRLLRSGEVITGVEYVEGGQVRQALAGEVILAAGALMTPKLLMLSGIGPQAELARHGITPFIDAPGVGQNLQDHHEVPVLATCNGPYGYFRQDTGFNQLRNGLQYLAFGTGPVTSNGVEAGAFFDPDGGDAPTVQVFCVPTVYLDPDVTDQKPTYGFTLNSCVLRPRSRGSVTLASSRAEDLPIVYPNYLHDPEDMRLSVAGLRRAAQIASVGPLAGMIDRMIFPSSADPSTEVLEEHCRRTVKTVYHPVGTARMGTEADPMAVVRRDLTVKGVRGLRIFDASVWPNIIAGNTNATTYAVADRGVSLMMGEALPAPVRAVSYAQPGGVHTPAAEGVPA